jgi:DNA-binding transcriptional LysR family regulator
MALCPLLYLYVECWSLGPSFLGRLFLVIGRRHLGYDNGQLLRTENLRWVAAKDFRLDKRAAVPLALLPVGCGVRAQVLAALDKQHRSWRPVYCGPSVLGVQAAVSAGLAIGCLTQSALKSDFRILGAKEGLPTLTRSEIVLYAPARASASSRAITAIVTDYFRQPIPSAS